MKSQNRYRIHRLVTGWLECMPEVAFMGGGRDPSIPGGRLHLRSFDWSPRVRRHNGDEIRGTMAPVPAWYIEGAGTRILVDTGTVRAEELVAAQERHGDEPCATVTEPQHDLVAQLAELGVTPEDIDVVVQTHLHFDHIGQNEAFKNATFIVNLREIPLALCPPPYEAYYYEEFGYHVRNVLGQIRPVHGDYQVAPGIRMVHTGGHSAGHSAVFVETDAGTAAIAGDAVYNYRNLEYGWPQGPLVDVDAALQSIQTLKTADIILVNHDAFFDVLFPDGVIGDGPLPASTMEYMARLHTPGVFPLEQYQPDPGEV